MAVDMAKKSRQRNAYVIDRIGNTAEGLADAVSRWKTEPTAHRKRNVFNSIGAMERLIKAIKNEVADKMNLPMEGCYKCSAHAVGKSTEAEREKNLFRVAGEWLCRECHIRIYGKDLYWEKTERLKRSPGW